MKYFIKNRFVLRFFIILILGFTLLGAVGITFAAQLGNDGVYYVAVNKTGNMRLLFP